MNRHGEGKERERSALASPVRQADLNADLSPEGRAVLVMLASTRSPDAAPLAIGLPTLKSFNGLAGTPDQDERDRLIS